MITTRPSLHTAFLLVSLLVAGSASAVINRPESPDSFSRPRHFVIAAEHTLLDEDRATLSRQGIRVVRELGGQRYIVSANLRTVERLSRDLISSATELDPASKIKPTAHRGLRSLRAIVELQVLFHDDVTFETARDVLAKSGAWLQDPSSTAFLFSQRIPIAIPRESVFMLVSHDEVMQVHGRLPKIQSLNASAARLSAVDVLHAPPYGLSGQGVNVTVYDIGNADAGHREFGGRLIAHSSAAVSLHPTHVAGTVGAAGIDPQARGMAPAVTIHQFDVDDGFLESKNANFESLGIKSDNNSWGYVVGWATGSRSFTWEWWGNELFGAYDIPTAGLDKIVRDHKTLVMFSSGNDTGDNGPDTLPFAHYHEDTATVWCYSADASGTGCPPVPCSRCEGERHPQDGPFGNLTLLSGKNVLTVGAVSPSKNVAVFSSRGPARDGRIKPDLVAKGILQTSTAPGNSYTSLQGTSMSSPVVTGISALVIEQWRQTMGAPDPEPEMMRALLINGAEDIGNPGPDYTFGFGLVNARASVDFIREDNKTGSRIQSGEVAQGGTFEIPLTAPGGSNIRVTMAWTDPENIPYPERTLINDLDLVIVDAQGREFLPYMLNLADPPAVATKGRNGVDNVEQVEVMNATGGNYKVRVIGTSVATTVPQTFAVISTATLGPAIPACFDRYEPNNSQETAFGFLKKDVVIDARLCEAADVDLYRIRVDQTGPITVNVTSADTPIRVTLSGSGITTSTTTVAAGGTGSVQATFGSGAQSVPPRTFTIKVEPAGTLGATGAYTLRPSFGVRPPGRRRGA